MKRTPLVVVVSVLSIGSASTLAQVATPSADVATVLAAAAVMIAGQVGYTRNCQSCHGASGEGGIGVRLEGNPIVQSSAGVVEMILRGYANHGMPPFASLDDATIAAIATYVRNSWGNSAGLVEPSLVAQIRSQIEAAGPGE